MLKKAITFKDFDGNEVTEEFYFNISKSELVELELSNEGGLEAYLKRIIASNDGKTIVQEFKKLILMSYGVKSEDGKSFIKTDKVREDFQQTLAFDSLFFELSTDSDAATEFVKGIIPQDMADEVARMSKQQNDNQVNLLETEKKFEDFSEEELINMPQEAFQKLVPNDPKEMTRAQLTVAFRRKNR